MRGRSAAVSGGRRAAFALTNWSMSASVTGSTAAYVYQQLQDFKSGVRKDYARMNGISAELSDEEMRQAAEYFAGLPRVKWSRVVEAAMVPKTFVGQGRMRFVDPKATGMEPIGKRIITLPEDQERARLRDPKTGCEWDTVQTFETIAPYTIEEAYEVDDAIRRGDMAALKDELGDLQLGFEIGDLPGPVQLAGNVTPRHDLALPRLSLTPESLPSRAGATARRPR